MKIGGVLFAIRPFYSKRARFFLFLFKWSSFSRKEKFSSFIECFFSFFLVRIAFDDNILRYELRVPSEGHRHHHLVCMNCGKVEEVDIDNLNELEAKIEKEKNFKITGYKICIQFNCFMRN